MKPAQPAPANDRQTQMARIAANFPEPLLQLHQWVLWKRESRGDNTTKVPYQPNGHMARSTDSATWSDYQTVEAAFLRDPHYAGIGFVFSEADPYVGIDLDKCRDPLTGGVEPWAADVLARLGTYTELSPSGKGFHLIGQARLPPAGRRKDRTEMYDAGRYFTVTGDHYGDSPSEAADIQAPLMALHAEVFAKPAKTAPGKTPQPAANGAALPTPPAPADDQAVVAAIQASRDAPAFTQFQAGNWAALGYASQSEADLAWAGLLARHTGPQPVQIDRLFRASGMMRPKWDEHRGPQTYGQLTITKALQSTNGDAAQPDFIDHMNQRFAIVAIGNQLKILDAGDGGGDGFKLLSRPDFVLQTANLPAVQPNTSAANVWLKSPQRRSYKGLVFSPGRAVDSYYNLWRGFSVLPQPGDCSLFWTLVRDAICAGSQELFDYVRSYCAHLVQRPWERPEVALVLRGGQGTGKNTFVDTLGSLVAHHFRQVNSTDQLTGRFNGHMQGIILLHANEASWGGNKSDSGKLKAMITDPKVPVEMKGQDMFDIDNYLRLVISSNEGWPVPIDLDDRRFMVLDVSPVYQQNQAFFAALHAQLKNGGLAALMHDLTVLDISDFSPRNKPASPFGADIKIRSADSPTRWLHDLLNGNTWAGGAPLFPQTSTPTEASKEHFYADYQQWVRTSGDRYPVPRHQFFKQLRSMLGAAITDMRPAAGPGQARERKLVLANITACRSEFETATGTRGTIAWDAL